ncbi:MAG TPA: hypothetical protein VF894_09080 [Anaeromyxobacter sp.]
MIAAPRRSSAAFARRPTTRSNERERPPTQGAPSGRMGFTSTERSRIAYGRMRTRSSWAAA